SPSTSILNHFWWYVTVRPASCINLIRVQKRINPLIASKSHQELHKEMWMTHRRLERYRHRDRQPYIHTVTLQFIEKWEQNIKVWRHREEAKKNTSSFHRELLKHHQKLDKQRKPLQKNFLKMENSPYTPITFEIIDFLP
uniref:Uncharacterized protein n=1 Tax=Myripristis murdjan TaxID=586833 RepID=A0A667YUU0_9TELE